MRIAIMALAGLATMASAGAGRAQSVDDRPWLLPNSILIIDPYQANDIDWAKLATDRQVKAMIHRAYFGLRPDSKYVARVARAKQLGLLTGIYLLGRPGDPIAQADALVAAGAANGVTMLALDIENLDPALSMTLANAERFIERVHQKTGRYPLFYTNFSTYNVISQRYDRRSAFARTPLWIARFRATHGMANPRVWPTYRLWQFQSELNCKPGQSCFRRVPGTASDMDINVFRGSDGDLRALFGAR